MKLFARFHRNEDILSIMTEWSYEKNDYTFIAEYYGWNSGEYLYLEGINTYWDALKVLAIKKQEVEREASRLYLQ